MSSTRLPGKVMRPILGEPMMARQIERLRRCVELDGIAVATSTDPADDVVADLGESLGCPVVRGPLDDVLARYAMAIELLKPSAVVRLTADCPLASPAVIDSVVRAFREQGVDYCSNTLKPTYPDGLDAEVVRPSVLLDVAAKSSDLPEREHVTLGVYRHAEKYRVANVEGGCDLSSLRWTVDTPEDFTFVTAVYESLYPVNSTFDLDDVLDLLERRPDLARTSADEIRNAALQGLDTGAMHG